MTSQLEAGLFVGHLKANGVRVVLSGNKEYASIITGQDNGRFEILVANEDYEHAKQISTKLNVQIADLSLVEQKPDAFSYYKKSIIFAFMSFIILPIIFNISSLYYLYKYIKFDKQKTTSSPFLILISIILNIIFGMVGIYILYSGLK